MDTSGISALKHLFLNEESNEEYLKRKPQKEKVKNTLFRLRKLPQKYRETLHNFINEEDKENVENIGNIIYFYLTRASTVNAPSMCFANENFDKRVFVPYQPQAPYFMATLMPTKREEIWEDAHSTAAYLEIATPEERAAFFTHLTKPHTPAEIKQITDFEQRYNAAATIQAQKAHKHAMANDSEYYVQICQQEEINNKSASTQPIQNLFTKIKSTPYLIEAGLIITSLVALGGVKGCDYVGDIVLKKNIPSQQINSRQKEN